MMASRWTGTSTARLSSARCECCSYAALLNFKVVTTCAMCCRYINPFPFEVVLAYDDSDDVNMLYEKVHHHA